MNRARPCSVLSKRVLHAFAIVIAATHFAFGSARCELAAAEIPPAQTASLATAIDAGDLAQARMLLAANPTLIDAPDANGRSPLFLAAETGQADLLKFLLTQKPAVNAVNGPDKSTALAAAAARGDLGAVRLLLAAGANEDARNVRMETPLFLAAANGHRDVAQVLVDIPAGINRTDFEGRTPLFVAADNGHLAVVALLLENGAQPNATMATGESALFAAVAHGHIEVAKAILEMGSLATFHTKDGETPLSVARKREDKPMIELLLKAGARMPERLPTSSQAAGP